MDTRLRRTGEATSPDPVSRYSIEWISDEKTVSLMKFDRGFEERLPACKKTSFFLLRVSKRLLPVFKGNRL
jgi:hypothetical protein